MPAPSSSRTKERPPIHTAKRQAQPSDIQEAPAVVTFRNSLPSAGMRKICGHRSRNADALIDLCAAEAGASRGAHCHRVQGKLCPFSSRLSRSKPDFPPVNVPRRASAAGMKASPCTAAARELAAIYQTGFAAGTAGRDVLRAGARPARWERPGRGALLALGRLSLRDCNAEAAAVLSFGSASHSTLSSCSSNWDLSPRRSEEACSEDTSSCRLGSSDSPNQFIRDAEMKTRKKAMKAVGQQRRQ